MHRNENCRNCRYFDLEELKCTASEEYQENFILMGYGAAVVCEGFKKRKREPHYIDNLYALRYLLAGESEATFVSGVTGTEMKYIILKRPSTSPKGDRFVYGVKTFVFGKWVYAGVMVRDTHWDIFKFFRGSNGELEGDHINIKSLLFVVNKLYKGEFNVNVGIFHSGVCGKCGKALKMDDSDKYGLGPECIKSVANPRRSKDAPNSKYIGT